MTKERKELYEQLDKLYNIGLSVPENLKRLKENGVNISKSTLYNYTISRDLDLSKYLEIKKNVVLESYNPELSKEENLEIIKSKGYKICKSYLNKFLREKDNDIK